MLHKMVLQLDRQVLQSGFTYRDARVVLVYLWAVLHDRPVCWACQRRNWGRHRPRWGLPSQPTMSRRLHRPTVQAFLRRLEEHARDQFPIGWCYWIDAKPLVIGSCSKDAQAGYGRAGSGKAKGYKFFGICNAQGVFQCWRLGPMQTSEVTMAGRMLRDWPAGKEGYLGGDGNYEVAPAHEWAKTAGLRLVAPAREGAGHGHRPQRAVRLAGVALARTDWGQALLSGRAEIERFFGHWSSFGGGLSGLPAWVRGHRRVRLWVQGKLILNSLRMLRLRQQGAA